MPDHTTRRARIHPADVHAIESYFSSYESDLGSASSFDAMVQLAMSGAHRTTGGRRNGPEIAMAARLDGQALPRHRAVDRIFRQLSRLHRETLRLAHGTPESTWPPQLHARFGQASGVAMLTPMLVEAHAAARRVSTEVPASPIEWLLRRCAAGDTDATEPIRIAAEELLDAAHMAYRAARPTRQRVTSDVGIACRRDARERQRDVVRASFRLGAEAC